MNSRYQTLSKPYIKYIFEKKSQLTWLQKTFKSLLKKPLLFEHQTKLYDFTNIY